MSVPHLLIFVQSILYGLMYIYFIPCTSSSTLFILLLRLFQLWPVGILSVAPVVILKRSCWFFVFSTLPQHAARTRYAQLLLCLPQSSQSRNWPFRQEVLVLLLEHGVGNQDLVSK